MALQKVMPMDGAVSYTYGQQTLTAYQPDARMECDFSDSQNHVQTAAGADFIAVCRQQGDKLQFQIQYFDVTWKHYTDTYFTGAAADDARLYAGDGLVALVYHMPAKNSYILRLYKRSRCAVPTGKAWNII